MISLKRTMSAKYERYINRTRPIFVVFVVIALLSCTRFAVPASLFAESGHGRLKYSGHHPPTDECFLSTDYGLVDRLRKSAKTFCSPADFKSSPDTFQSSYTFYHYWPGSIRSTVFRGLRIDMTNAKVMRDIASIAEEDGVKHNPRYKFTSVRTLCQCEFGAPPQTSVYGAPRVWYDLLMGDVIWRTTKPVGREPTKADKMHRVCEAPNSTDIPALTINESVTALLVSRFEDHNPFFQVSQMFNTWVMMNALGWSNNNTQVVYLDKGLPSPVDELRQKLLGPTQPSLLISELMEQQSDPKIQTKIVEFGSALITPYEWTGPLMRNLDTYEPCARSQLIIDFRSAALTAMGIDDQKQNSSGCTLTIISRRDYGGRHLERVWVNEQEVADRMAADFEGQCTVQVVDFMDMSIADQMRAIVNSDIIIGLHGAGMTNVMWTRPGSLVIEVFPIPRRRWGYRNICQQLGVEWHDFRGGEDIINPVTTKYVDGLPNPNKLDKSIPADEWAAFANPLIRSAIDRAVHS